MSKREKLLFRFLNYPKDFTYAELKKLLSGFGFYEDNAGKTSGSRVCFIKKGTKEIIMLHKPHPENILKAYQIKYIIESMKEMKLL